MFHTSHWQSNFYVSPVITTNSLEFGVKPYIIRAKEYIKSIINNIGWLCNGSHLEFQYGRQSNRFGNLGNLSNLGNSDNAVTEHEKYAAHATCDDVLSVHRKFEEIPSIYKWTLNHARARTRALGRMRGALAW
jgi:hypothetical protein